MGLDGVREAARRNKGMQFTALLHHITPQLLAQSFYALRRDAAVGVDGMSWREYEEGLLQRVNDLHGRLHSGAYRATPSRRVYIPKADGRQRPLGIASLGADSTTLGHSAHDHLDTRSTLTWTPDPRPLDRQSERSDAGLHC
jgi:hypothetical protein